MCRKAMPLLFAIVLLAPLALVAQDAPTVAPTMYKVLLDDDRVRVMEVTFKPGAEMGVHTHLESVVHALTAARLQITYANGKTEDLDLQAGETMRMPAGPMTHHRDWRSPVIVTDSRSRMNRGKFAKFRQNRYTSPIGRRIVTLYRTSNPRAAISVSGDASRASCIAHNASTMVTAATDPEASALRTDAPPPEVCADPSAKRSSASPATRPHIARESCGRARIARPAATSRAPNPRRIVRARSLGGAPMNRAICAGNMISAAPRPMLNQPRPIATFCAVVPAF